ncbi:MAG: Ig-like domain-containing protein [Cyclobacteriaceae bacterium]|nr:Ig-like domain-containing protein [Cyclobacteriaceae bacterium]
MRIHCIQIFLIILFASFTSCQTGKSKTVSVVWKNNKAVAIAIPLSYLKDSEDPTKHLAVQLIKSEQPTNVLGEFTISNDQVLFEPLVPLTRNLEYDILFHNESVATVAIPPSDAPAPELLSLYPTQDTIPENLLKIYLRFSQPMEEGHSLSFVTVLKNDRDTMKGTFLDLQPELWSNDGTMLTLWLDPGRIKRELIPNLKLGAPLITDQHYTLLISGNWKSKEGILLKSSHRKEFITTLRDDQSPQIKQWTSIVPAVASIDPLTINFKESLDYGLLNDAVLITDERNTSINGTITISNEERTFQFVPETQWKPGNYSITFESRLEDLSGNNLDHPFDRDLKVNAEVGERNGVFKMSFTIR